MENAKSKPNVVIIDGYGFIFRAFFSLKDLKTKSGIPTGAVHGFINMILKLYSAIHVDYVILVFDSGSKSFRNEIYPEYKANRAEAPEDLKPQFQIVRQASHALNIKFCEVQGMEADDIIATYCKNLSKEEVNTIVVTSDKDLMQLVELSGISIFDPIKSKFISYQDIEAKFGVKPFQIVDYLAIVGDSSDNIPGVYGIGEKGAGELLKQFKTVEEIYENIESIEKPRIKKLLLESKEKAFISKKLASLRFDVPVPDFHEFKKSEFNKEELFEFLNKYDLHSLIAKLLPNYNKAQSDLFAYTNSENVIPISTNDYKIFEGEEEILLDAVNEEISIATKNHKYIIKVEK